MTDDDKPWVQKSAAMPAGGEGDFFLRVRGYKNAWLYSDNPYYLLMCWRGTVVELYRFVYCCRPTIEVFPLLTNYLIWVDSWVIEGEGKNLGKKNEKRRKEKKRNTHCHLVPWQTKSSYWSTWVVAREIKRKGEKKKQKGRKSCQARVKSTSVGTSPVPEGYTRFELLPERTGMNQVWVCGASSTPILLVASNLIELAQSVRASIHVLTGTRWEWRRTKVQMSMASLPVYHYLGEWLQSKDSPN